MARTRSHTHDAADSRIVAAASNQTPTRSTRSNGNTPGPVIFTLPPRSGQDRVVVESVPNLKHFPVEILQEILGYLDSDKDIVAFAQICRLTHACTNESIFRQRFLSLYDTVEGADRSSFVTKYKRRAQIARYFVRFDRGIEPAQGACLLLLLTLIKESNARVEIGSDGKSTFVGHNHAFLRRYATHLDRNGTAGGTNLLHAMGRMERLFPSPRSCRFSGKAASLPLLIQLCLLHLSLDPTLKAIDGGTQRSEPFAAVYHCYEAQQYVYRCYREEPIFLEKKKMEINVAWLLHVATFFRFHLMKISEGVFGDKYITLDERKRPRAWTGRLQNETQQLAKHWKGTYCYLPEGDLQRARSPRSDEYLVDMTGDENDGFQNLTLFFDIHAQPRLQIPRYAELLLHSTAPPQNSPSPSLPFFGLGYDGSHYHFNGRIAALTPQQSIPGFQRVSMLKYLPDKTGRYGVGHTQFWAFDGAVLPGARIMLGRWWDPVREPLPDGGSYCGPFIFWAVEDGNDEVPGLSRDTVEDALQFLDEVEAATVF